MKEQKDFAINVKPGDILDLKGSGRLPEKIVSVTKNRFGKTVVECERSEYTFSFSERVTVYREEATA